MQLINSAAKSSSGLGECIGPDFLMYFDLGWVVRGPMIIYSNILDIIFTLLISS